VFAGCWLAARQRLLASVASTNTSNVPPSNQR